LHSNDKTPAIIFKRLGIIGKILLLCKKKRNNMAKPIRNTPILYGKDASQFLAEIENLPTQEERKRERARIDAEVNYFLAEIEKMKKK
jgi:hypothetical protein